MSDTTFFIILIIIYIVYANYRINNHHQAEWHFGSEWLIDVGVVVLAFYSSIRTNGLSLLLWFVMFFYIVHTKHINNINSIK